jgi:DNA-binding HxlR family transcriptional regulator
MLNRYIGGECNMKEVVEEMTLRERREDVAVEGLKHCDLWISMRKFANPDIALIARVLYEIGPATLAQLREETKLTTNILNHDLIEMRKSELVVKEDKRYAITKYGALLVEAIEQIKKEIFVASATSLFQPVSMPRKEGLCVNEA